MKIERFWSDDKGTYHEIFDIIEIYKTLYCNGKNSNGSLDLSNIGISYTEKRDGLTIAVTRGNHEFTKDEFIIMIKSGDIDLDDFDYDENFETKCILKALNLI